jgi:hypothetical protein
MALNTLADHISSKNKKKCKIASAFYLLQY